MEIKVRARTIETPNGENTLERSDEITVFAGKAAGTCYMPDDYMDNGIQNSKAALKRANNTASSGHHSVYDHTHITYEMHVSKMICMILNSLGVYTTSEKSSRYTRMNPSTKLEVELYDKWNNKLRTAILDTYKSIDDARLNELLNKFIGAEKPSPLVKDGKLSKGVAEYDHIKKEYERIIKEESSLPSYKLAQENARYMISVFTPTVMIYTMSDRQSQLVMDYMRKLKVSLEYIQKTEKKKNEFTNRLLVDITEFINELGKNVVNKIHDTKNQYIRFLEAQHVGDVKILGKVDNEPIMELEPFNHPINKTKEQVIGDSYTLNYKASLAMIAQKERHRTLRISIYLKEPGEFGYYIPEIVKKANLEEEWLQDIKSVSYCTPQGTLVDVTEQGIFEDFALMCKERLCGCAQFEIMRQTTEATQLFIENKDKLSELNQHLLETMTQDGKVVPRCKFADYTCSKPCMWGPEKALTRLV